MNCHCWTTLGSGTCWGFPVVIGFVAISILIGVLLNRW